MAGATINLYPHVKDTKSAQPIPLSIFLDDISSGRWQDIVLPIRTLPKEERRKAKEKTAPCVTISGMFDNRKDEGSGQHSGFIGIDIDDVDPEHTKEILAGNPYVFAMFTSISASGLCVIFKIVPDKHREAFNGISEYLFSDYNIVIDPTSINPARARFVSYDPHIYTNETALVFKQYPKYKAPKIEQFIFSDSDFDRLIHEIKDRGINLVDSYHDWLRVGFALVDKFGESGSNYFHIISANSQKYKPADADRQYRNCLKAAGGKRATIATFYYYAKQAGLSIYSKETKQIIGAGVQAKKGGRSVKDAASNLKKFEGVAKETSEPILEQVFASSIEEVPDETLIDQLEQWITHNYSLRRNDITRYIENGNIIMKQKDFNTVYIKSRKIFEDIGYDIIERLINSDFTPTYNPLISFFDQYGSLQPYGNIENLFDSITSDDYQFTRDFGTKWLVGLIAAIHGQHNPYMLVLSGKVQGTGKTEFFRRLLPDELKPYYAESKLDAGKDDEILMTQKLLIMDDEMGGKNKNEVKRLKELLSRQTFSLREPYGKNNVDLNRLATLCGTTNDEAILNDPTGNRRIIPIGVYGINHKAYNAVNKRELIIEAYHLWKNGFDWELSFDDIKRLNESTGRFESFSLEYELINKYYTIPEKGTPYEFYTSTEIKNYLETHSVQKLSQDKLGKELGRLGFEQEIKRVGGKLGRWWRVQSKVTP